MKLQGKTCIVTGANSGLGFCAARRFARLGAAVTLVCRDKGRGQNAVDEILKELPDAKLELAICDFTSFRSVRDFIREFKASHDRLDVLFNNAAIWKMEYTTTEDGFETMFQVNCLVTFVLMQSMLDLLKRNPDPRIINIAVPGEKLLLNMENTQNQAQFNGFNSFFQTKLWLVILSTELSRRLAGSVPIYVTDPGPGKFKSNITRDIPGYLVSLADLFAKTADQAAQTIEYLATSDDADKLTNKVFMGKRAKPMPPHWLDAETGKKLWSAADALLPAHE